MKIGDLYHPRDLSPRVSTPRLAKLLHDFRVGDIVELTKDEWWGRAGTLCKVDEFWSLSPEGSFKEPVPGGMGIRVLPQDKEGVFTAGRWTGCECLKLVERA